MAQHAHEMAFGAQITAEGVRFRLWAPDCDSVTLCLSGRGGDREIAIARRADGWCEAVIADAGAGTRYAWRIDGGMRVPDPASRFQPDDVHGASEVVDAAAFRWQVDEWRGRPWEEAVLYELHVGTFTPAGTFRAVIDRLDHLVDLGVTAIELMPVADFPGRWNWGYDGCYLFAPDARYGRPEDLKALIDAAHGLGLMVFLDVVYNHFGPEGNYLHAYAKRFFNPDSHTPWGAAINFDGADSRVVRDFYIENALFWIEEYRIDGLRFDAVHAIEDRSSPDILVELAERVKAHVDARRHVHLVLENDDNEARYLARAADGRPRHFVAQWNDDIHHAVHVLLTGEAAGYYADYADRPADHLGRCLAEGFAYQGEPSRFHDGERRGERSRDLPPTAFVSFIQNHDQVGNRAFGDRLAALAPPAALSAAAAVLLLAPSPPLLFMGEEWAAETPFLFFCDFGLELRDTVREGRRQEFAAFPAFQDAQARERIPDPALEESFRASLLDWMEPGRSGHRQVLELYRRLFDLRRREIVPRLAGVAGGASKVDRWGDRGLGVVWTLGDGSVLSLVANLSAAEAVLPQRPRGRLIYATPGFEVNEGGSELKAWSVAWFLEG